MSSASSAIATSAYGARLAGSAWRSAIARLRRDVGHALDDDLVLVERLAVARQRARRGDGAIGELVSGRDEIGHADAYHRLCTMAAKRAP